MNASISDELLSINAIYVEGTLSPSDKSDTFVLRIPMGGISLRLSIPIDYPDRRPVILGPESSGAETRKGEASEFVELARALLTDCFTPGTPCIYDLVEKLTEEIARKEPREEGRQAKNKPYEETEDHEVLKEAKQDKATCTIPDVTPSWTVSEVVTEKKSVFLARAAHATTLSQAQSYIENLITTDRKVARATHNISAWRIQDPTSGATFQDSDDDGEAAAGGRLLHLLQVMDVWNVVVAVSRWYGGIQLGPDRFRFINSVARDALVMGRFGEAKNKKASHRDQGKH